MQFKKGKAAILARVSRPSQTLESQINDLISIANKDGYSVPKENIFKEQISGMNAGYKESLNSLLSALDNTKNKIKAVYIWEITRLNRGTYDFAEELRMINSKNVPVYFYDVDIWTWDFNKNELNKENCDKLIGASFYGRLEWKKIAQRTKRGRDNIASQGYYIGHVADGYIPFISGKHKLIKIDEERRPVIENIFSLYTQGYSTKQIAAILNAEKVPTTNKYRMSSKYFNYSTKWKKHDGSNMEVERADAIWSGTQISQILTNKWYIGERLYNGQKHEIEPIISKDIWNNAQIIRAEKAAKFRTERISKIHQYLLAGYIYCGHCGLKMYGHTTGLNNHYYCSSVEKGKSCGTRGVCKENVEAIVCDIIKRRAIQTVFDEKNDITADFFRLSDMEISSIRKKIQINKKLINSKNEELQKLENKEKAFYEMLAEGKRKDFIDELLSKLYKEQSSINIELSKLYTENTEYNQRIKANNSILEIIKLIKSTNNIDSLRKLIENTIYRIEIDNIDKSITTIQITYINNKIDTALYAYRLLKNKYVHIPDIYTDKFRYNPKSKQFDITNGYYLSFGTNSILIMDEEGLLEQKELEKNADIAKKYSKVIYSDNISARDLIKATYKGSPLLYSYDRSKFRENSNMKNINLKNEKDEAKLNTQIKNRNSKLNSEKYIQERKRLYNRKYKIKKNKSLSIQQKEIELKQIDKALFVLKEKWNSKMG